MSIIKRKSKLILISIAVALLGTLIVGWNFINREYVVESNQPLGVVCPNPIAKAEFKLIKDIEIKSSEFNKEATIYFLDNYGAILGEQMDIKPGEKILAKMPKTYSSKSFYVKATPKNIIDDSIMYNFEVTFK